MVDKVKPLKIENSALGGTENDFYQTETDPNEDYLATKGISLENSDVNKIDLSADANVQSLTYAAVLMNRVFIPDDSKNYIVSQNYQFMFFDELTIDGEMTFDGDLVGL